MSKLYSLPFLSINWNTSNNYEEERLNDLEEEIALELEGMSQFVIPLTDEVKYGSSVEFQFNKAMLI